MENYKSIYCTNCKKHTDNSAKLSAVLEGKRVCKVCSKMNGVYTLTKQDDVFSLVTVQPIDEVYEVLNLV